MPYQNLTTTPWDDLLQQAAIEAGSTRERARAVMSAVSASIVHAMRLNTDYTITGFGTFSVAAVTGRNYFDPHTRTTRRVSRHKRVRFDLTPYMRARLTIEGFTP